MNTLVHSVRVADKLVVEDCEALAGAIRYFGTDLPLEKTTCIELLIETLPDGSEVSTIRLRPADSV